MPARGEGTKEIGVQTSLPAEAEALSLNVDVLRSLIWEYVDVEKSLRVRIQGQQEEFQRYEELIVERKEQIQSLQEEFQGYEQRIVEQKEQALAEQKQRAAELGRLRAEKLRSVPRRFFAELACYVAARLTPFSRTCTSRVVTGMTSS